MMPALASMTFGFSCDSTKTVSNSPVNRHSRALNSYLALDEGTGRFENVRFVEEHQKKCLVGTGLDVSPFEWRR